MRNSQETLAKRNAKRRYHYEQNRDFVEKFSIRTCRDCGLEKPCRFNSTFSATGQPEYKTRCDECMNVYHRKYQKAKSKIRSRQATARRRGRKQLCVEYKGGSCAECGYSNSLVALTFHHREPEEKAFEIAQHMDTAWERLKAELDKCDLLCFNCHMETEEQLDADTHPTQRELWEYCY